LEASCTSVLFCFHTTMVLTQQFHLLESQFCSLVFPYHYGSHATRRSQLYLKHTKVSIPLWFSRNSGFTKHDRYNRPCFHTTMVLTQPTWKSSTTSNISTFPYHYGSHATRKPMLIPYCLMNVSIPLWFSRNQQEKAFQVDIASHVSIPLWFSRNTQRTLIKLFIPEHVSIPLWFLRNSHRNIWRPSQLQVSIPLWFLRNQIYPLKLPHPFCSFHTTMVLTQQKYGVVTSTHQLASFHTTMVHTRAVLRWPSKNMDPSTERI